LAYGFLAVKELSVHCATLIKHRSDDELNAALLQSLYINIIFFIEVLHKDRIEFQRSKFNSTWHRGEANAPKDSLATKSLRELYGIIEDEFQIFLGELNVLRCLALKPYSHDLHDLGNGGRDHLLLVVCRLLGPDRCHFTEELGGICAPVVERFVGYDLTICVVQ
jgi:hypothetical protein